MAKKNKVNNDELLNEVLTLEKLMRILNWLISVAMMKRWNTQMSRKKA